MIPSEPEPIDVNLILDIAGEELFTDLDSRIVRDQEQLKILGYYDRWNNPTWLD